MVQILRLKPGKFAAAKGVLIDGAAVGIERPRAIESRKHRRGQEQVACVGPRFAKLYVVDDNMRRPYWR